MDAKNLKSQLEPVYSPQTSVYFLKFLFKAIVSEKQLLTLSDI